MTENKAVASLAASIQEILDRLQAPFDEALIEWKPQSVARNSDRAMAAAYADPRAYSDRLNEVLGPEGWTEKYSVTIVPCQTVTKFKKNEGETIAHVAAKVIIVAEVRVLALGVTHSGTGEAWANDDNASTAAEAQAFKRACARFGLGRYLYNLPTQWVAYDSTTKRLTETPELPDWARPKKLCEECNGEIVPVKIGELEYGVASLIANSRNKYRKQLCGTCQKKHVDEARRADRPL